MSNKLVNAACMRLVLMAGAALPLHAPAQSTQDTQASAAAVTSRNDIIVVRDADTGALRAPTSDEHAAMEADKAARAANFRVAPQATLQRYHASGARGARLTDDFMSTSIARIQADGSIDKQCFDSPGAAQAGMAAASASAPLTLETE